MKHGNNMANYKIIREHDGKAFAWVKGYDFAVLLAENYNQKLPENKFLIIDKKNEKTEKRGKKRIAESNNG